MRHQEKHEANQEKRKKGDKLGENQTNQGENQTKQGKKGEIRKNDVGVGLVNVVWYKGNSYFVFRP